MNLVLFDFDGTITTHDTYTKFILSATSGIRLFFGGMLLFPVIILNKIGILSSAKLRPLISKVAFTDASEKEIRAKSELFVAKYLPGVTRAEMLQKIHLHKSSGDRVILVSASVSPYLKIWCENLGLELICSELEVINGRYTGSYLSGDCSNETKVARIRKHLDISVFNQIIAYGDTKEDFPMLNIANVSFLRGKPFLGKDC